MAFSFKEISFKSSQKFNSLLFPVHVQSVPIKHSSLAFVLLCFPNKNPLVLLELDSGEDFSCLCDKCENNGTKMTPILSEAKHQALDSFIRWADPMKTALHPIVGKETRLILSYPFC